MAIVEHRLIVILSLREVFKSGAGWLLEKEPIKPDRNQHA